MIALDRPLSFTLPLQRGEDVRAAQQALIRAGVLAGEADGVFGPATRAAVLALQRREGLAEDGTLGALLWERLLRGPALRRAAPWTEALRPFLGALLVPHGPPAGAGRHRWRLAAGGVLLEGEAAPRRSPGQPRTAALCWAQHRAALEAAAQRYAVPVELLLATACTESGGRAGAVREEPGFLGDRETPHRVSPGLMQTLISTAREALGEPGLDRAALLDPRTSAMAGAAYIRGQAIRARLPTGYDPPLVAIAYNAGSLRPSRDATDPWGLVQTRRGSGAWHADSFCAFLGDALAVLGDQKPAAETPCFAGLL
ncbi:peptidoglycan-binding protein [Roseococcus sp. DSY-14]|uniref:peptidoglycan-binding protein n=1 Tax=Roseococcus sp. DSY-14 TaxID=3369650 RepID=UPI00387B13FB